MSRTPARCTEADMNRAAKVAKKNGMEVLILRDGTIKITPVNSGDETSINLDELAGASL